MPFIRCRRGKGAIAKAAKSFWHDFGLLLLDLSYCRLLYTIHKNKEKKRENCRFEDIFCRKYIRKNILKLL